MTDVIFTHSYTNTSCLQVFLYTDIDNLFKEAAFFLSKSSHQEPLFAIVASHKQKEALLSQLYHQNGFTSFFHIETLQDTLQILLQKYCGYKEAKIHDTLSLTLAIYELILKKDPAVSFLNISQEMRQDLSAVFTIASTLALEVASILEKFPESQDLKVLGIKKGIKALWPEILFLDEAFILCKSFYDKLLFIGFNFLPLFYIELLKETKAHAFFLVPSLAFLGDVLSPKQRLQKMRDTTQRVDNTLNFKEHPFLQKLSNTQKEFYRKLVDLAHVHISDDQKCEETTLEKMQASLKSGIFEKKYPTDQSVQLFEVEGVYKTCLVFFSCLQELFQTHQELKYTDIAIITDQKMYAPILNAIGQSSGGAIKFGSDVQDDNLWGIIKTLLLEDEKKQNFFINFSYKLLDLFIANQVAEFKIVENLIEVLKTAHLGGVKSSLKGEEFLQGLKNSLLKASFFDLHENEIAYEGHFFTQETQNDIEPLILFIEKLESLVCLSDDLKNKHLSINDWCRQFQKIITSEVFESLSVFQLQTTFFEKAKPLFFYQGQLTLKSLFLIFKDGHSYDYSKEGFITIYNSTSLISKSYKVLFYLGSVGHLKNKNTYLADQFLEADIHMIGLNQVKDAIYIITEKEESSHNPKSSAFIDTFKKELLEIVPNYKLTIVQTISLISKPFVTEKMIENLDASATKKVCKIDIQKYQKFLLDLDSFIKKEYLHIYKEDQILDKDIYDRHLFHWLLQKYYCEKAPEMADTFYKYSPHVKAESYLRSYLTKKDALTQFTILEPYKISLQEGFELELYGLSDEKLERKLESKHDDWINFLKIKDFIEPRNVLTRLN